MPLSSKRRSVYYNKHALLMLLFSASILLALCVLYWCFSYYCQRVELFGHETYPFTSSSASLAMMPFFAVNYSSQQRIAAAERLMLPPPKRHSRQLLPLASSTATTIDGERNLHDENPSSNNSYGEKLDPGRNMDKKIYWIATHFRSGSTLLSTLLSIPQDTTLFLFEPLHFLQPSNIIAVQEQYKALFLRTSNNNNNIQSTPPLAAEMPYNFTALLAAVTALRLTTTTTNNSSNNFTNSTTNINTTTTTTRLPLASSALTTAIPTFSSPAAPLQVENENDETVEFLHNDNLVHDTYETFFQHAIPDTTDLRLLSRQLLLDILQCRIVNSPEARVYYLNDGFVNFDANIGKLKARWRAQEPEYYLQQVQHVCEHAQRIVVKTIRADMQLVLDVASKLLLHKKQQHVHVVHLWRHPLAIVNSAFGRTSVRPFSKWVRMFCHVLYVYDYLVADIVQQQLQQFSEVSNQNSSSSNNLYTRIFYDDLIERQRQDPNTLRNFLNRVIGEDSVTVAHQRFIGDNFNSANNCAPHAQSGSMAKRRDQGSFALCRTKEFDPQHWKKRPNKGMLAQWQRACKPAVGFYEAKLAEWQKFSASTQLHEINNGKEIQNFYPV